MMSIWFETVTLDDCARLDTGMHEKGTLMQTLGIKITEIGEDYMVATMPAGPAVHNPLGLVHGGANVVLAETLGSMAGAHVIDSEHYLCMGQEVSATHLRPVSSGLVTGTARPIHLGRRSHVWEIRLTNDQGKLSCIAKLILAIVPKKTD